MPVLPTADTSSFIAAARVDLFRSGQYCPVELDSNANWAQAIADAKVRMQACSHLIHYHPDATHTSFTVAFASNYITRCVFERLKMLDARALPDTMDACKLYPKAASLRQTLFEQLAHSCLSKGGSFIVRNAGELAALSSVETCAQLPPCGPCSGVHHPLPWLLLMSHWRLQMRHTDYCI